MNYDLKENEDFINSILEEKEMALQKIDELKCQLEEAENRIKELEKENEIGFIGRMIKLLESISTDEYGKVCIDENVLDKNSQEIVLARYFLKLVIEKARDKNLDPLKIVSEMMERLK